MIDNDIKEHVIAVLQEIAPEIDPAKLDPAVSFRDQYQLDSVDFLNFVLKLEKRLGLKIPDTDYPKLSSLNGCDKYLKDARAAGRTR